MIAITISSGFGLAGDGFDPLWIGGFAAWSAALLLFADTSRAVSD
jgi:hypothetical protein